MGKELPAVHWKGECCTYHLKERNPVRIRFVLLGFLPLAYLQRKGSYMVGHVQGGPSF